MLLPFSETWRPSIFAKQIFKKNKTEEKIKAKMISSFLLSAWTSFQALFLLFYDGCGKCYCSSPGSEKPRSSLNAIILEEFCSFLCLEKLERGGAWDRKLPSSYLSGGQGKSGILDGTFKTLLFSLCLLRTLLISSNTHARQSPSHPHPSVSWKNLSSPAE